MKLLGGITEDYDSEIVVVNGVITRRYIAEYLCTIMKGEYIIFPASRAEVEHYIKVQKE